jgi:hypothetical protein
LRSADLIVAKGQDFYKTLSEEPHNIFLLFKGKCSVIGSHMGFPVGTYVMAIRRGESRPTAT